MRSVMYEYHWNLSYQRVRDVGKDLPRYTNARDRLKREL